MGFIQVFLILTSNQANGQEEVEFPDADVAVNDDFGEDYDENYDNYDYDEKTYDYEHTCKCVCVSACVCPSPGAHDQLQPCCPWRRQPCCPLRRQPCYPPRRQPCSLSPTMLAVRMIPKG